MFSIGEFSRISGLSIRTLRFYHDKGLLEPAVIDPESGYRYYDTRSVELAGVISGLKEFEIPLDDIAQLLGDCGDDQDLLDYLGKHKRVLAEKAAHYRNLEVQIEQVIEQQNEARKEYEMSRHTFEISERVVETQLVAGMRTTGKYSDSGKVFSKLAKKVGRYISGKPICLYYDGEYREDDAEFEPCFPLREPVELDQIDVKTLPEVRCITLTHQGPYETLGRSYALVMDYANQKGYEIELPTREVYLKGPGMIFRGNPKKYLTEIQVPIRESH